jgi:SAM-dependent methyltransferase
MTFDAARYKETTRQQWQDAADAWHRWSPTLTEWLGPATERMLDLARVSPGDHVLDVAAGAGEQTIAAARRVGKTGRVLATDLAPRILERAASEARRHGLDQIAVRAMDGEALDLPDASFDVVISRVGLIYMPDRAKALAEMRRVLKPGGRVAAIVYSTADRNGFFSVPVSIIRKAANLGPPAPGQPGPFCLGAPNQLAATLADAGFSDVQAETVAAPLRLSAADECVRFEKESFGALHQMLSGLDDAGREAAWTEIASSLKQFEKNGAFEGPCELVVAVGTKVG